MVIEEQIVVVADCPVSLLLVDCPDGRTIAWKMLEPRHGARYGNFYSSNADTLDVGVRSFLIEKARKAIDAIPLTSTQQDD